MNKNILVRELSFIALVAAALFTSAVSHRTPAILRVVDYTAEVFIEEGDRTDINLVDSGTQTPFVNIALQNPDDPAAKLPPDRIKRVTELTLEYQSPTADLNTVFLEFEP